MSDSVTIHADDGDCQAYLARPAVTPAPAVVVVQEIFGVNADLRATCDELAAQGYLALSPDLFWRMQPGVDLSDQSEDEWQEGMAYYDAFDYDAGVADIVLTMDAARSLPESSGKVGLMGYCLGGLMTFLTTARNRADASVVYCGGNTEQHLSEAGGIRNPTLLHFGEEDEFISKAAQRAIAKALASNAFAQVFTYPGCRHAFARHRGKHYDADAAALANGRTARFFEQHLR